MEKVSHHQRGATGPSPRRGERWRRPESRGRGLPGAGADRDEAEPVVALLGDRDVPDLMDLLAGSGLPVRIVGGLAELIGLVEAGQADAVVVDPQEVREGWTVDVAADVARRVAGRVPLVVACHSRSDVELIKGRVAEPALVLLLDRLGADLPAILRGEISRRRAGVPSWNAA